MLVDKDLVGFAISDNGSGALAPETGDNYTSEDGQTVTGVWSNKTLSVKVKVTARLRLEVEVEGTAN